MDTQTQEQQQKEFLSSFFPLELPDIVQRGVDGQQPPMYHFNGPTTAQPSTIGVQHPIPNTTNPQQNGDLLGNLVSMQGIESQPGHSPQTQYTPQMLLEQQFKLSQLQQLQQLQNQIFQQQARIIYPWKCYLIARIDCAAMRYFRHAAQSEGPYQTLTAVLSK